MKRIEAGIEAGIEAADDRNDSVVARSLAVKSAAS